RISPDIQRVYASGRGGRYTALGSAWRNQISSLWDRSVEPDVSGLGQQGLPTLSRWPSGSSAHVCREYEEAQDSTCPGCVPDGGSERHDLRLRRVHLRKGSRSSNGPRGRRVSGLWTCARIAGHVEVGCRSGAAVSRWGRTVECWLAEIARRGRERRCVGCALYSQRRACMG